MIRETVIGIDSYLRDSGTDGCFSITLDRRIPNVQSCQVIGASIPYSILQINGSCDSFLLGVQTAVQPITTLPELFHYTIPHGTYSLNTMVAILNELVGSNMFSVNIGGTISINYDGVSAYDSIYFDVLQVGEDVLKLANILGFTDIADNTNYQLNRTELVAPTDYNIVPPERVLFISCPEIYDSDRYADTVRNEGRTIICRVPTKYSIEGIQHFAPQPAQMTTFLYSPPRHFQVLRFRICSRLNGVIYPIENGQIHIGLRVTWKMVYTSFLVGKIF